MGGFHIYLSCRDGLASVASVAPCSTLPSFVIYFQLLQNMEDICELTVWVLKIDSTLWHEVLGSCTQWELDCVVVNLVNSPA